MSKHEREIMTLTILGTGYTNYIAHNIEVSDLQSEIEFFKNSFNQEIKLLLLKEDD